MRKETRQRAAYLLRILFLLTFMVGISVAWFNQKPYSGGKMEFQKKMQITTVGGNVTNYIGSSADGSEAKIDFRELKDGFQIIWSKDSLREVEYPSGMGGFSAKNVYPGARIYIKTRIENNDPVPLMTAIYLSGLEYSEALNRTIYFTEIQPAAFRNCYANDAEHFTGSDGEAMCRLSSAQITKNFQVPAAIIDGGEVIPGVQEVYWYIEIDGNEADNSCMDTTLEIRQMQLITSSGK